VVAADGGSGGSAGARRPLPADAGGLVELAAGGTVRATARLLSRLETGGKGAAEVSAATAGRTRAAAVWGLTGPPGVGKSTLTAALISDARAAGRRVAVLAVDPSSPFSGGALLGDRVRMAEHVTDIGVFIRSMASRGHLGGLSSATPAAVDLMSAIGFELVLVETVGVGQNEIDVLRLADTVAVVTAPGAGDGIQAAKAGILEIADVLVVNKADREGAAATVRELKSMVALGRAGDTRGGRWRIPVLATTATTAEGIPALVEQFRAHAEYAAATGLDSHRRRARSEIAVQTLVLDRLHGLLQSSTGRARLTAAATEPADSGGDANRAAATLWRWIQHQPYQ